MPLLIYPLAVPTGTALLAAGLALIVLGAVIYLRGGRRVE